MKCIQQVDHESIELLLNTQIGWNQENKQGETCLSMACKTDITIVQYLLQYSIAIHYQSKLTGQTALMMSIIELGEQTDKKDSENEIDESDLENETDLIQSIHLLLQQTNSANDLNLIDHEGNTALHYAVQENIGYVVKWLLKKKCNVEIKNKVKQHRNKCNDITILRFCMFYSNTFAFVLGVTIYLLSSYWHAVIAWLHSIHACLSS